MPSKKIVATTILACEVLLFEVFAPLGEYGRQSIKPLHFAAFDRVLMLASCNIFPEERQCAPTLQFCCGALRVPEMVEYIEPALSKGLADNHPYVRRVCVMGLVKLWRLITDRSEAENQEENEDSLYHRSGMVNALKKALYDADAQVRKHVSILACTNGFAAKFGEVSGFLRSERVSWYV